MKWPIGNDGATYLRDVTDTVQTVEYNDSQCTVHVYTHLPPRKVLDLFLARYETTKQSTFNLSILDNCCTCTNGWISLCICFCLIFPALILVYHGLSWSISVILGLSLFISVYLSLSWSISVYLGLTWSISDYLGLSWTIWDYLRLSGTIWDFLGLSGTIWDYLGLSGSLSNCLRLSQTI